VRNEILDGGALRGQGRLRFSSEEGVTGSPAIQSCFLRSGLTLSISRPSPSTALKASFDMDDAPIQFGFTYSGKNRCVYSAGGPKARSHEMQAGSNGIFHLPKTRGVIEQPHDCPPCVIGIIASPELLHSYFAEDMAQLPEPFRKKLEGRVGEPMTWFGPCSQAKHHLLSQILNCPFHGGLGKLFLESRAMELLTLQLHDYIRSESGAAPESSPLCPADVERIRHAREILVRDLEKPPRLSALALAAGINEKKLKAGFRQVFNTSVFGYLREYRLQRAYELLQRGDHNVTEAAFYVGYQSLSHFSQAFRERFGLLPKQFLTNQRRFRTP
jgi:AraC-like DNA-binding protein